MKRLPALLSDLFIYLAMPIAAGVAYLLITKG